MPDHGSNTRCILLLFGSGSGYNFVISLTKLRKGFILMIQNTEKFAGIPAGYRLQKRTLQLRERSYNASR